ncbi:MAG TPA: rhomboid-like protein [Pseudonocardiaceae bacterium]|nr:rhomboid-like protein [Pseudonocardiaceae bacterium]
MWTRVRRIGRCLPSPRTTPFTFWYLGLLGLTTILLHFGRPAAVHRLLAMSSTDAANLERHPVRVLFLSALWLQDAHWLVYAAVFTVVLAPLERRIGTWWTVLVFASGHVLASLATELPVLFAVRGHLLPDVDAHLLDVGVSYGLCAVAGASLLMLRTPARWWALGGLAAAVLTGYLLSGPASPDSIVTVVGHTLSLTIGLLGWLPLARRRGLIGSLRWPAALRPDPTTVLTPART